MTVQHLIEILQKMPGNTMVIVNAGKNELGNGLVVGNVECIEVERYRGDETWHERWNGSAEEEDYEYRNAVNITC